MEQPADQFPHTIRIYSDPNENLEDDLRSEYDFSKMKSLPDLYAERARRRRLEATEEKAEDDQSSEG